MTEQVLDVRGWLRLVRRFWRIVAVFVVLGVAAAAAYVHWVVPGYQASSLVLLPTTASSGSGTTPSARSVTTDARIAVSAAVLVPAGREIDRSLDLPALQRAVSADSTANSVLRITARSSSAREAEALANAVANQLVTFVANNGSTSASNVVAALHSEDRQLTAQLNDAQGELTAAKKQLTADQGTGGRRSTDTSLVNTLSSEVSSLNLQLDAVKAQTTQAALVEIAANQGTEVIQKATSATPPSVTSRALPLGLGALGGLLVGSLVVLAWYRRNPRLRTRDGLAEAVGAPVVSSLALPKRRTPGDWAALFESYAPSALEQWTVRRALREIGAGEDRGRQLTVLALAGDRGGMAQAAHVAVAMADSGTSTAFAVTAGDEGSTALRAACARLVGEGRHPRADLTILESATAPAEEAQLVVELVVVDPEHPTPERAGRPGTVVVLAVSSGFPSAEELAGTAIAAADGGRPVEAVLVVNPTSADRTAGRFAETSPARPSLSARRTGPSRSEAAGRTR